LRLFETVLLVAVVLALVALSGATDAPSRVLVRVVSGVGSVRTTLGLGEPFCCCGRVEASDEGVVVSGWMEAAGALIGSVAPPD
jgi:uncharacterized membrane protein YhiD involved in acid resistance